MRAIYKGTVKYKDRELDDFVVRVIIISDTVPAVLPTNGTNVDGMADNEYIAPGSILYVVATGAEPKWYLANESGVFVAQ